MTRTAKAAMPSPREQRVTTTSGEGLSMIDGILAGLRIVEGSAFVAAPSAGMPLAQMGADVIRFDLPGGGIDHRRWPVAANGTQLYWAGLNQANRSLAVHFRKPYGPAHPTAPNPQ